MRMERVAGPIGPEYLEATVVREAVGSVAPRGFDDPARIPAVPWA